MSGRPEVVGMDWFNERVMLSTGDAVPITEKYIGGEVTYSLLRATSFVAGSDEAGWFACSIASFVRPTIH